MQILKQILAVILILVLCIGMSGCASSASASDDKEQLIAILDGMAQAVENGNELSVAKYGLQLVNWFKATKMEPEAIASTISSWLQTKSPEFQQKIQSVLGQFMEQAEGLISENGEKIKEGLEDGSLQEQARSILNSILESGGVGK